MIKSFETFYHMLKSPTPTKICQHRPGRKSREKSESSGHVGKGRELVGIGREMSVSVMGGGLKNHNGWKPWIKVSGFHIVEV